MDWINNYLQEAGFEDKPKGWTDKSVKKYSKTFSSKMKGNVKSPKFFKKCVNKMQGKVDNPEGFCAALKDEAHGSTYWRGKDKSPKEVKKDVSQHQNVKESTLIENFLQSLYTDNRPQAKEWRGTNIPIGDEDNRPNLIRQCMTIEGNRQKINCLRKLRDQVAMNPFYQARLDRFVDAITDIYEPTNKQGTISGNEFKPSTVGEDTVRTDLSETLFRKKTRGQKMMKKVFPGKSLKDKVGDVTHNLKVKGLEKKIERNKKRAIKNAIKAKNLGHTEPAKKYTGKDIAKVAGVAAVSAGIVGAAHTVKKHKAKKLCRQIHKPDSDEFKACVKRKL